MTRDPELVAALRANWRAAPIDDRLRAILSYAERLTRTPAGMRGQDVAALRQSGLGDRAIIHVAEVVAYFNFVNRLADGLGVELEEEYREHMHG